MSPDVLLLSTDTELFASLSDELRQTARIDLVRSPQEVIPAWGRQHYCQLLVDARAVLDGGHSLVEMLDRLADAAADANVVVLCGERLPEPLERRATCAGLRLLRGAASADSVAALLPDGGPSADAGSRCSANAREGDSGNAMRQFETNSPTLRRMLDDLAVAAEHDVTILLIGETGSGKTYLSRLIHEASPRRELPFLTVACGALPRELIESELFGHVKGAFTSAHADKNGKFLAAGGGTILLDEIDVLGLEQQVKLLRVIESREFEPVGSNQTLRSQARLVVASNLDLQPLVESGRFRPDLYYRLNMLKFEVPPLRSRKSDIVPLANQFIARFSEQHKVVVRRVESSFCEALLSYPWPGNVRELEHVIQRSVIYCRTGVLTPDQLPPHVVSGDAGPVNDPSVQLAAEDSAVRDASLEAQVAMTEKDLIVQALARNGQSRTKTARELGISRVTLYNKMKRYSMLTPR